MEDFLNLMTPKRRIFLTFVGGIVNELIQVAWVHHAEAGAAAKAALVTLIMCVVGLLGVTSLIDAVSRRNWSLFIKVAMAWAFGSALGTYIGVILAKG